MTYRILLAGAAATALLAGCDRQPATPPAPPAETAAPAEVALAPAAPEALPPAPPAPVAAPPADDGAAYWREAEQDDEYYDDRPPSYAYDYGDEAPAVWLDGEMVRRVVERLTGGGERYYYYRPGQDRPYYVQDPDYGYGYDDGALVTVYDVRQRRALDRAATRARAAEAGRYLARSQALRRAALQADQDQRRRLDARQWRQWQARQDRRATPVRPTPPSPVVIPPVRDDRDESRDRGDRGRDRDARGNWIAPNDRGDRGRGEQDRPRGDRPVATPTPVPPPKAVAAETAREQAVAAQKAREEARRVARLKREADIKARREAAAARLKPPQTPAPPASAVAPAQPATPALKPEVPAVKGAPLFAPKLSKTERQKAAMAARAAEQARKAKAKADAEAARAARAKAAADKAAADAAAAAVPPKF